MEVKSCKDPSGLMGVGGGIWGKMGLSENALMKPSTILEFKNTFYEGDRGGVERGEKLCSKCIV